MPAVAPLREQLREQLRKQLRKQREAPAVVASVAFAGPSLLPLHDDVVADGAPHEVTDEVELDGVGHVDAGPETNAALGGALAPYTCPECKGNLWEIEDGKPVRFRCRVGHSYDEPTLLEHKDAVLEAALWTAVTALEENASLARQVADRALRGGRGTAARRFARRAVMLDDRARTVRTVLEALPASLTPLDGEPTGAGAHARG
jgi:two-component system chemotaxis response regulator CheB